MCCIIEILRCERIKISAAWIDSSEKVLLATANEIAYLFQIFNELG